MNPILSSEQLREVLAGYDCFEPGADPMAYSSEGILYDYYEDFKDCKTIVEIGTFRGISALVFASWGLNVHTFDVQTHPGQEFVCDSHPLITRHLCRDRDEVRSIVDSLDFDCAWIDAVHDYENVSADFEIVKRCGRVGFHDYDEGEFPGVFRFLNEIGARPGNCSAIWIR